MAEIVLLVLRLPVEGQVREWCAKNTGGGRHSSRKTTSGDREDSEPEFLNF